MDHKEMTDYRYLHIDPAIDEWTLRTYNPAIKEDSDSDDTEVLSGRGTDDDYGFEDYMGSDLELRDDTDDMDQTDEYDSEDDFIDDGESCEGSEGSSNNSEGDSGDDEDEDDDDADSADDDEDDDEDVMLDDETEIDDDSEDQQNVEPSDILIEKNISISGHQNLVCTYTVSLGSMCFGMCVSCLSPSKDGCTIFVKVAMQ
ncbi:prothymosin alpha-A-like [Eutrema salsugineum]|uniref:prothymosin alpha-A-like n=1 Tax=Eutrema salsugineum TaxID=72664 RepID=UPI000CED223E|nr:prothymosin alpha-A-like [Eutrema salsugineum]